jgi:protein-S-isoprenylcysteine O-methyltransferase Ste14
MAMMIRHLLSILILPVMMAIVIPRWLLRGYASVDSRWPADSIALWSGRVVGGVLLLVGLALFAWCLTLFARVGKGTLAPWDPTKRLVAEGPYRYIRNPMITGVLAVLAGEAVFLGSRVLGAWFLTFLLINNVYFRLLEEPGLERRFGASYKEYKQRVPRWFPRWRAESEKHQ